MPAIQERIPGMERLNPKLEGVIPGLEQITPDLDPISPAVQRLQPGSRRATPAVWRKTPPLQAFTLATGASAGAANKTIHPVRQTQPARVQFPNFMPIGIGEKGVRSDR